MTQFKHPVFRIGFKLAVFAIIATSLVVLTERQTHDKIQDNIRQRLLAAIHEIVPPNRHDNAILHDTILLSANPLLHTQQPTIAYRARLHGQPVAVIFTTIAPDGYSGAIKLLIGINYDGTVAGVRVVDHKETPGLGDRIDTQKSDWIKQFTHLSLSHPEADKWAVKKDGGQFDQFTGATITPRAVVKAIKNALLYFQQHRDALFEESSQ